MDKIRRQIDVLLFDGINVLDVAGPAQAFSAAYIDGDKAYGLRYISIDGRAVRASCGLSLVADASITTTPSQTDSRSVPYDLLIPGGVGIDIALEDPTLTTLIGDWHLHHPGGRLAAVCSGALLLANSGILDGKPATTHWSRQKQITLRFPAVQWDLDRIYILQDGLCTSAGVTTGIDMALKLIRQDCGSECALRVAQELVVSMHRTGGQRQFAPTLKGQFATQGGLGRLIDAMFETPQASWTLTEMAAYAHMTPRSLSRHFKRDTGLSAMKFLEHIRVRHVCDRLLTGMPMARVLKHSGFGDAQRLNRAFQRVLGTSATAYQRQFADPDTCS
jgi:transcriptional regulator GlxA family with amidase domain